MFISQFYKKVWVSFLACCFFLAGAIDTVAQQTLFEGFKGSIVLDPGHGGYELGAGGPHGTLEKAVTLEMARMMAAELERKFKVALTRTDDYQVDLDSRVALANHLKADIFISIHTGGSFVHSTSGALVFYYQNFSDPLVKHREKPVYRDKIENVPILWNRVQSMYLEKSRVLAQTINARLNSLEAIGKSRLQGAPLAVLKNADMPAVLIEIGYLTNPAQEKKLRDHHFLSKLAGVLSRGIEDFLSRKDQ